MKARNQDLYDSGITLLTKILSGDGKNKDVSRERVQQASRLEINTPEKVRINFAGVIACHLYDFRKGDDVRTRYQEDIKKIQGYERSPENERLIPGTCGALASEKDENTPIIGFYLTYLPQQVQQGQGSRAEDLYGRAA